MSNCIVVFDDEQGLCFPMCLDPDCEGAIYCGDDPIALFPNRAAAMKAIKISKAQAKLKAAQGAIANTDFLECASFIKIKKVELVAAEMIGGAK